MEGAELLYSNRNYCTAVHSSYYSSILLMFHVLSTYLGKSDDQIEIEREDGARLNKGTHLWLKRVICEELHKLSDSDSLRTVNNTFGIMKQLRIESDYKNREIVENDASSSIKNAKIVNEVLNRKFSL